MYISVTFCQKTNIKLTRNLHNETGEKKGERQEFLNETNKNTCVIFDPLASPLNLGVPTHASFASLRINHKILLLASTSLLLAK